MKLPISEIFFSIQGEGVNIGKPSIFIRFYFCNLSCIWCDSKYTWENQDKAKEGIDYFLMDIQEILNYISKFDCNRVVITGGEPLLHQEKLKNLLKELKNKGFYIEIETNGTIKPKEEIIKLVDLFNVSPKLSNSKVDYKLRIRNEVLKVFSEINNSIFKFVICDIKDLDEVDELVKKLNINKEKVYLMPEGTDEKTIKERSLWLIDESKKRNYNFTTRLHILMFGNQRGK
ncbi:MAG: 7-carboxy-7-deazaguanine synthase QueE [Thermoproteota archaeon]|jgi:7-cyano-7-deazaguanosine (preQ0) biosynthesis protein QueE|nr:7-carboxy-7-deazaguanine synthase QueE [Thermoproteota archaeon]